MSVRFWLWVIVIATGFGTAPAQAQFFMKSPDVKGDPVTGLEPGIAIPLPGATPAELRAGMVWTLRAALNVSALQCQFEPTLLTVPTYNALLGDHKEELQGALDTLTKYYKRTNKSPKVAQTLLDQYGTKVYSSFSTTRAQYIFCQTASAVGRDALFVNRGELWTLATTRMQELRNSLIPRGEQAFPGRIDFDTRVMLPRLEPKCWKRDTYDKRCGYQYFPS